MPLEVGDGLRGRLEEAGRLGFQRQLDPAPRPVLERDQMGDGA
jgi:hypothetical protein